MIVNMPDGKKVTFPDDVDRNKVRNFIIKNYPEHVKEIRPDIDVTKLSGLDVTSDDGLNSSPMEKIDTMLSLAGLYVKSQKDTRANRLLSSGITAARTLTNTDYSKLGSEAAKSAGRQATEQFVGGTGFFIKNYGRLLHDDNFTEDDFNKDQPMNTAYLAWKGNQFVSDTLTKFGETIEDLSKKIQNSEPLKADEKLFAGSFEENPNLHKGLDLAMSSVASVAANYGVVKMTNNPMLGLLFMSGVDAKDVLEESLEAGESKGKSFSLWATATLGTAILEKFGLEKVFGTKITNKGVQAIVDSSKKTSEKILDSMLSEGGTELLQTVLQNTVSKIGYDETRDIFQNALESAIGGALGGGLVSSFNYGIQAFNKKADDAGLTQGEKDNIVNAVSQTVSDKPNLVNAPLQENMKKTYESFRKRIEEMGDTPERQRLIATKNALDQGYNKYYEELKNYMPEEQAKANANLIRSSALFFSDLEGITVDEWFKTKNPEIRRMVDNLKGVQEQRLSDENANLNVNDEAIDVYGDEYYKKMTLTSGNEQLGSIDYSVYDGKPYIQMISVPENQRRKGYATELVKRLQKQYPDQEIDFGMTTEEGTKLYESLPKRIDVDPKYDRTKKQYERSLKKLKEYEDILDQVTGEETGEEQERIVKAADAWNKENAKRRKYEDWLNENKRETVYIDTSSLDNVQDNQEKVTRELNSDSNNIEFNMESLKDKNSVDYLKSIALKSGMTNKQFDSLMNKVFDVADTINDALKDNPDWKNWNAKQIKTFVDAQGIPMPIRSAFVKNGDYDFNIDLGTLCVKREFADKVIKHLIDKGYGDQIGLVKLEQIKALLRKYEIAVACDVCFIEGKRLNARTLSNGLAYEWESVRQALGITDDLSIGTERTFSSVQEELLDQMTDRRYIKDDGSIMSEEEYNNLSNEEKKSFAKTHQMVFQKAYEDYMPIERRRVKIGNTVYDRGITSDKMYSIAKLFKQNSELAGVFDPDYLMNSEQTTALAERYYDTELPSFLGSYAGAGTPKPLYGFNPYYELSWRDKYDRNPDKLNEMIFGIGGVRGQSFSDYNEMLVIDYIQKYLAETVRALPAHEYTKQASLVKTFGDTGVMFNMSFVPKIEEGVDSKHYGLRKATEEEIKNGKSEEGFMLREDNQGVWTYSFHSDSFPVGEAMQLRNQFDKTSGIIVVGVSDMQIEMLLDDPNIDMVIPFHASGMPAHTKLMTGLVNVDYSKEQTTKGLKTGQEDFSYNAELRKIGDPRKTAQAYKDWCKEHKLTEKFPQFSNNKNYYKLLEDFRGYDKNGKPIIQGAVDISKADWNRITQEAISGVKERTGVVESAEENLVSEEFTKELEDIFKYQQVDTEVQNLFKKRLTSVLGKGNAVFLKQDKFLEKVREFTGSEVFRNNQDGTVYGFALGNKVFINESAFNAHTPAHEFTHIWAKVVQQQNPKLWKKGVGLLKQTNMWKDVQKDEMYWQIQGDENAVAREVLARLTGTESEAMIRQMLDYHTKGHANAKNLVQRIMDFLKEMFGVVKDAFNLNGDTNITFEDFIRMPLRDLLDVSRHKAFKNAMKKANLDGTSEFNQSTYYQSAFAGSRVDYDTPSLEAIGSGEGNQAHGWGLYYALNKDVAEGYRNRLTRAKQNFVSFGEITYDKETKSYKNAFDGESPEYEVYSDYKSAGKDYDVLMKSYRDMRGLIDGIEEKIAILEKYKDEIANAKEFVDESMVKGQVHEVDIPENPYLLDEQFGYEQQPELVQKAFDKIADEFGIQVKGSKQVGVNQKEINGKYVYNHLADKLGSPKAASEWLNKNGIKGITYDGRQDGRCFVIFNPADVRVIQKFYQNEQAPLGAYANRVIYLNKTANASTLPHELAHFWSDELKQSKSPRAKEIIRQADVWEDREFDRKYKVVKQENGFAVTDKDGKTVYDRMGEGFATEEQAKAYAKEELFARGFEKYLREGKAPNKTLKQAFRNFYNWLKKLYVDMMNLDIKLSPNMRNLYADILGGTSIDTFLDSEIDEFIDKRTQAEEDKSKQVQGIIEQAQANDVSTMPDKIRKAWRESDWGDIWKKLAIPLSTRAKRISPRLRTKIRQFEFDVMDAKQNYYREVEPMLKKWDSFSKEDRIAFDLALKNSTTDIRDELLKKYNATEDFARMQKVLEDIYEQALDAGLEVGYLEDYFPRKVIDKDGLMDYLHNTEEWSGFQQALQREDPRGEFSAEEKAEFIDKYLRGIVRADLASYKYSSEKQRKLDIIDNNLNQYYADSMQAFLSYVDGMNARIQTSNFFGRNRQNIDESIGEFIAYMLNNGEIKPSQVDEVKNILSAVFKRKGVSSKGVKFARDISYIYTMGGINTAITQLDDWFVAAYKGGAINTFKAVFSKDVVTKKDLGLDSIAAEFMNGSGTAKAVNWVFKHNGIELIDGFGKNALLNGTLRRMQKMSDAELRAYVEPIMEERTDSTIADIRNRNLSKDVRFFLFNEMSDMQPVSLSELPELYNVGGNGRIFYMLKSFMLKRIDTIRNECYDKIRSSDKAERIKGWQNLYKLAFLMMLGGATKDLIIDLMYRRVVDISDMMVNNLLGIIGISKYNIYQVREEGMGHTLAIFVAPPLWQVLEDLSGDAYKYIEGKRELKDFEVFKGLPMIGRFYYWWIGGGKTKTEKKKKKGS